MGFGLVHSVMDGWGLGVERTGGWYWLCGGSVRKQLI